MNERYIYAAVENNLVDGIKLDETWHAYTKRKKCPTWCDCDSCLYSKSIKTHIPKFRRVLVSSYAGEWVWTDTCEVEVRSLNDHKHVVVFVDDWTRFRWVYFLRGHTMCEMKETIENWYETEIQPHERRTGLKLVCLSSDNGTEYLNEAVVGYLRSIGVRPHYSPPDAQALNGVAERTWRYFFGLIRATLIARRVPKIYWVACCRHVCWTCNRMPCKIPSQKGKEVSVPYTLWYNKKPNLKYARPFFARAMVHQMRNRQKLDGRAREAYLLCYDDFSESYVFAAYQDDNTHDIVRTIFVRFIENERPNSPKDIAIFPPLQIAGTAGAEATKKIVTLWADRDAPRYPIALVPHEENQPEQRHGKRSTVSHVRKLRKRLRDRLRSETEGRSLAFRDTEIEHRSGNAQPVHQHLACCALLRLIKTHKTWLKSHKHEHTRPARRAHRR